MTMRSSAARSALGIGATTSTAFTACSSCALAAAVVTLSSATRRVLLGIDTTVQRRPLPSAFTPMAV